MEKITSYSEVLSVNGTNNREAYPESSSKIVLRVWMVASVKMHHEQRVSDLLTKMGIDNFVPVQKEYHKWSDRVKPVSRTIIPMIVFVYVARVECKLVLGLSSVIKFMVACGEHRPAVIPDQQMDKFKFMLESSDNTVGMAGHPIKKGEKVKIIKGPLADLEGELITINSEKEVGIYLNSLGYVCVKMSVECIAPLK